MEKNELLDIIKKIIKENKGKEIVIIPNKLTGIFGEFDFKKDMPKPIKDRALIINLKLD